MPGSDIEPGYPFNRTNLFMPKINGFNKIKEKFKLADVVIGNLEGPICHSNCSPYDKGPDNYSFRIPPLAVVALKHAGFTALNIVNNHSFDCKGIGFKSTINHLLSANINIAGLYKPRRNIPEIPNKLQNHPVITTINNIKIGILGFATRRVFKSINYIHETIPIIQYVSKKCNILIVSFHGGAEGLQAQHVTGKMEWYKNEKRGNVYAFAHTAVDNGADIVFGHGPHVLRGIELYKNRIIAYSLGNFYGNGLFNAIFRTNNKMGISCILHIKILKSGAFSSGTIIPISIKTDGLPKVDKKNNAIKIIKQLSIKDFPLSKLIIKNNGEIFPAN